MGLLDKLKNVFFEEEYVEVEEKNEPKEKVTVAKKIETPEVRKKDFKLPMDDRDFEMEKTMDLEAPMREVPKEEEVVREEEPVKEEPVVELRETREYRYEQDNNYEPEALAKEVVEEEHHRLYESDEVPQEPQEPHRLYEGTRRDDEPHRLYEGFKEKEEQRTFKPSPIISPIYGILNKNYTKEEIMTKKEVRLSQISSSNVKADLDIVREKAYCELAGDISASIEEDTKPKNEPKEEKTEKKDLVYDLNEEESPTVKEVTVGDAEEYFQDLGLEYNVDYKVEKNVKEEKEEPKKVVNDDTEESEDDKNLFDLIDSMYEDEDEKSKDKE